MGGKKRFISSKSTSSKNINHPHNHTPKTPDNFEKKEEINSTISTPIKEAHHKIEHHIETKPNFIKKAMKIEHNFPPGMKMLLMFSSLMLTLYIFMTALFSFTIVLGVVVEGIFARLLNILIIIMISFMLYGFAKKRMWSYHLSHFVFLFVIINSFISMFLIKKSVAGILTVFVTLSFFFILLMNFITLWYVRSKKNYFLHHYHENNMEREDKTYIFSITSLWLIFILVSGVLGNAYYVDTVAKVDTLIYDLKNTYPFDVEDYCFDSSEKDLCLLTAAIMYEKELNANKLCKSIDSQFHRYTCFRAIEGDLI